MDGPRRRVVVTGLGVITPLGNTVESLWEGLCSGRSAVGPITSFDANSLGARIAAEVHNFVPPGPAREARHMDRCTQFALAAALQAWQSCGLVPGSFDPYDIGVVIGTSHGGEQSLIEGVTALAGERRVSPWQIPRMLSNMASARVGIDLGLRGPSFNLASACATGAQAIGEAAEIIRRGDATAMLCGGADACITALTLAGDHASGALSTRNEDPSHASRPFDVARDGFVIGEGAGVLVVEDREQALSRGAHIFGEIRGYAATSDALHETHPDQNGLHLARAIQRALAKAGLRPEQIDAVFAHATGTPAGDRAEVLGLTQALGTRAGCVPVTAIKGGLGHLMGAAGAVQIIVALQAIAGSIIPPITNLESSDPDINLQFVVGSPLRARLNHVLSNSIGFGGHNVALVISAPEE